MAERPRGFGMTAELAAKKDAKYDSDMEVQARQWIVSILGSSVMSTNADARDFHETLKDGKILCNLANAIRAGSVKKINDSKMAFKMMENIGNFLTACESFGVPKTDLFQTVDHYENQNMPQVINGIHALGRKASTVNSNIPHLGPKESTANRREFSEDQLREGRNVIGLQMGSNKGASQAGMTPYGQGRSVDGTR